MAGGARPGAGRPSSYSIELAQEICKQIACGSPLTKICKQEGFPSHPTVYKWLNDHSEFLRWYAHARELQAETMVDKILELGDSNGTVDRGRLAALTWAAEKLSPRKYGTKVQLGGDPTGTPVVTASVNASAQIDPERYEAILARLLRET